MRRKTVISGTALLVVAVLAGCTPPPDRSEIATFTDEHGRACTAVVVVDQDDNRAAGREVGGVDCDYPPEGRSPGPSVVRPLPAPAGG